MKVIVDGGKSIIRKSLHHVMNVMSVIERRRAPNKLVSSRDADDLSSVDAVDVEEVEASALVGDRATVS